MDYTFDDCVTTIARMFDTDYTSLIRDGLMGEGHWISSLILLKDTKISEVNGRVYMNWYGLKTDASSDVVSAFCSCFNCHITDQEDMNELLELVMPMPGLINYNYKNFVGTGSAQVVGQAKILVGVLDTLVDLTTLVLYILVIGSSSPGLPHTVGLSYDILPKFLTQLGYKGVIHLYDQYEIEGSSDIGDFTLHRFAKNFNYQQSTSYKIDGHPVMIINDDAWRSSPILSLPSTIHFSLKKFSIRGNLSTLPTKYVMAYKSTTGTVSLCLGKPSQSHKDIDIDPGFDIYGGGTIFYCPDEKAVYLYGASTSYGPSNQDHAMKCLERMRPDLMVIPADIRHACCRMSMDPDMLLVKCNPQARISMKYFGEDDWDFTQIAMHGGRIAGQFYYKGAEKRLLFNVPKPVFHLPYGDGCRTCHHMGSLCASIKSFNGSLVRPFLTHAMSSVLGTTCTKTPGQKFSKVVSEVYNQVRRNLPYVSILKTVSASCEVDDYYIDRAVRYLQKLGTVKYYKRRTKPEIDNYPHRVVINTSTGKKQEVYYNRDKTEYILHTGYWRVYDVEGREITTEMLYVRLANTKPVYAPVARLDSSFLSTVLKRNYNSVVIDARFADRFDEKSHLGAAFGSLAITTTYVKGFSTVVLINPFTSSVYHMESEYTLHSVYGLMQVWHTKLESPYPDLAVGISNPLYLRFLALIPNTVPPPVGYSDNYSLMLVWNNDLIFTLYNAGHYDIAIKSQEDFIEGCDGKLNNVSKLLLEKLGTIGVQYSNIQPLLKVARDAEAKAILQQKR